MEDSSGATVRGNLIADSQGAGIDTLSSTGAHTIENNTITTNGTGMVETPGIRLYGNGTTLAHNLIYENYGAGVLVTAAAVQNTITQNSIYDNGTTSGQIGIDLLSGGNLKAGDSPFVTVNDTGDGDSGGNDWLNFPILDTARTSRGNLVLTGFARPGSVIELFIADGDTSGFVRKSPQRFKGSGSDLDNTTGSYGPGQINNLLQGSDTTNRFHFEIPLPGGVSQGTLLTATATLGASTSEFSGQVPVDPPTIYGSVFEDFNGDADPADAQPQTGLTVALYRDGGDGNAKYQNPWQVAVSEDLPDVLDNGTSIDGTAYSLFNGTSLRDENPGVLGTGGTVGVDSLTLPTLGRPEFEIVDSNNKNIGLDIPGQQRHRTAPFDLWLR